MIIPVTSLDDERLDAYVRLTDLELRNRLEPEKGVFVAESGKVIERALAGGMDPLSLLMEEKWLEPMASVIARAEAANPGLPVFVAPQDVLRDLVGFELTRGALGAFRRPRPRTVAEVCEGARRVAVLENITNHTNVGAIFRSAAALGIDAVLVTPSCYDPLYRRAIRVSMGTVFQVPWARIGEDAGEQVRDGHAHRHGPPETGKWSERGLAELKRLGFATAALALSDDSIPIDDARLAACDKLAMVLGTEGDGLSRATIAHCDYTVRIPMAHGVDSLNVAAASAVAFWELRARG